MSDHKYDVALSFAGEDRGYVHTVATILRDRGLNVFYDEFRTAEMWGRDLYDYLDEVYRIESRYAVMFASASYARNIWTSHERQSIQARVMMDSGVFLLPVRLDDTEIPGLRSNVGYLNGQRVSSETVAELIMAVVGKSEAGTDVPPPTFAVPLTADERLRLLAVRPAGWEYLVLASVIWQEWQRLEAKRLDHELGFAAGTGRYVTDGQLHEFFRASMDELHGLVSKVESLVENGRFDWAVGAAGEPGDAVRIEHLGGRFGVALEDLLDWAARVRATVCDPDRRRGLELLALLADHPVRGVEDFVHALVDAAGTIARGASARSTATLDLNITMRLTIAPAAIEALSGEIARLGRQSP